MRVKTNANAIVSVKKLKSLQLKGKPARKTIPSLLTCIHTYTRTQCALYTYFYTYIYFFYSIYANWVNKEMKKSSHSSKELKNKIRDATLEFAIVNCAIPNFKHPTLNITRGKRDGRLDETIQETVFFLPLFIFPYSFHSFPCKQAHVQLILLFFICFCVIIIFRFILCAPFW